MRSELPRPSVVLFDLDNTLYEYEPSHVAALAAVQGKVERELGVPASAFEGFFVQAKKEVKGRLTGLASEHSRLLYFQRMIEIIGLRTQPLLALDLEQTYWRAFMARSALFPGVRDFLEELELLGIQRALVTDLTAQIQFRKLVYFQIEGLFEAVVTSEESGREKPDPVGFRLALEKLGAPQGPIWMIGDDLKKDMLGAKEAVGATTVLRVDPRILPHRTPDGVDAVFDDFRALLTMLRQSAGQERAKLAVGGHA
jgi:putative hydrolase of the HAD superfamily